MVINSHKTYSSVDEQKLGAWLKSFQNSDHYIQLRHLSSWIARRKTLKVLQPFTLPVTIMTFNGDTHYKDAPLEGTLGKGSFKTT